MSYWKISTWIISAPHYQGIGYTLRKRNMLNDATNNSVWYAVLSRSVVSDSLWPHGLQPTRLLCPWGFSRQEYWSGCHALLQGLFQTQGLNPGLLHWRWILYRLSHQGSSRILEWVAYPFSRGSSQPRNQTRVSLIASKFFTSWATREAQRTH